MSDFLSELKENFPGRVKVDELLSKYSNFRLGGPAQFFLDIKNQNELILAIDLAKKNQIDFFVFGGGSNLLINDEGFTGLVLRMTNRQVEIRDNLIIAEAGALTAGLARVSAEAGLAGLTWAIGLPGTIGGAVRGNAGCFGGEMKDVVKSVTVLKKGEIIELNNQELDFAYRNSLIKTSNNLIILSVTLSLKKGDSEKLKIEIQENLQKRQKNQPQGASSAGCIFKNYEIKNDQELQRLQEKFDIPLEMIQTRRLSTGWIIDKVGLKGKTLGQAQISPEHGNFILNLGQATASEIMQLISLVKMTVRDQYGIQLEEEVQLIGF